MELKVWVEGIQRIVCGVTDATTCQDVVFALAHATGKTGRFTLIEKWRNNSRLLAPTESPLKILNKLGEYSGEVQFILQKSEKAVQNNTDSSPVVSGNEEKRQPLEKLKAINDNVGIVKGVPQYQSLVDENFDNGSHGFENTSPEKLVLRTENSSNSYINQRSRLKSSSSSPIGVNVGGSLNPPPYRNPPLPSSKQSQQQPQPHQSLQNPSKIVESNNINIKHNNDKNNVDVSKFKIQSNDESFHSIQYNDLVHLIKLQREKIINQQNDLTKFDAEIVYLENKSREQIQQFELISQELTKTDLAFRQGNEQLQLLHENEIARENEILQQKEKTLKAELSMLRSKLGILETDLENTLKTTESLKKEVSIIEISIIEKKKQLEKLVQQMKEVNLQSLTVTTEDHHLLLDAGSSKRRMIGSPRQLVNAPAHGVWV
ncbi:hypothetical protein PVAND_011395 [Polypedilum vanderplanki]|uniref:Ras-associating domain-containing protein n=1 Tax=Polypedilum vanderplanki TaxID=319348 RepID=A0A9J6CJF1_POLVA|nr:hypothetical protein PVAND_011395 [Polypedilum vanderplanki]